MERIWSPWRSEYMQTAGGDEGCFLCATASGDRPDPNVLHRGAEVFVVLNAFPYNTGHLMIVPYRHVAELDEMSDPERFDMISVTSSAVAIVREAMRCQGFNLGMNLGLAAGAGVPGHAHLHVVPRWGGDTNFMPVVGETKVLPEMLEQTRERLIPGFRSLGGA
jgi:ATP adenylyltransferase